jgi:hypothetical protein
MKNRFLNAPKKWTTAVANVHSDWCLDGQVGSSQVVDSSRKVECPLMNNLGVILEGTLPGKQK